MAIRRALVAAALLLAAATGCGAAPPRVWTQARRVLPVDVKRVVYADLGHLARSALGQWVLGRAGSRLGVGCDWAKGELIWVTDDAGHAAVFASIPGQAPETVANCLGSHTAAIWLTPSVVVLGQPESVAALTAGAGAFARDDGFATALVDVDYGAAVWAVFRSKDREARGLVRLNVSLGGGRVAVEVRIPAGGRAKAWAMAFMLEREMTREKQRRPEKVPFETFSAGVDGDDVVVYASLREDALGEAMDERMR